MRALLHFFVPLAILALGIWGYVGTQKLKEEGYKLFDKDKKKAAQQHRIPPAQRKIHTKVTPLQKCDHLIYIQSQGIIRAHNAATLTSQVNGRIVEVSPNFEDGAFFSKDDVLLKLDTADFLTELETAKARLAKALAQHAQEEAKAKQALLNWRDAGFKEDASDLVLRKPQLRDAQAGVAAAESAVNQATRNLARTQVRAPYDGRVHKRKVGLGQQIGASTPLAEIFATDFVEVRLPLTTRDLRYYSPPNKPQDHIDSTQPPSNAKTKEPVTFTSILQPEVDPENTSSQTTPTQWTGSILRAEGALDPASRQLFVIARIDDPFAIQSATPALFIGQPVRASIPAHTLKDVFLIPRTTLSGVDEILVVRDQKITRLNITPIWSNAQWMAVRNGILPGDRLCTSKLPYAPEGAPVEIIPDEPKDSASSKSKKTKGNRRRHTH